MPDITPLQDGFLTKAWAFLVAIFAKVGAGAAGAFLSLKFVKGTTAEKVWMAIGGVFVSIYATGPAVRFTHMTEAEGLVGFLLGLFGMALVAKTYEALQAVDAGDIARRAVDRLSKLFGG